MRSYHVVKSTVKGLLFHRTSYCLYFILLVEFSWSHILLVKPPRNVCLPACFLKQATTWGALHDLMVAPNQKGGRTRNQGFRVSPKHAKWHHKATLFCSPTVNKMKTHERVSKPNVAHILHYSHWNSCISDLLLSAIVHISTGKAIRKKTHRKSFLKYLSRNGISWL